MRTAIDSSVLWSIFKGESDARDWVSLLVSARRESNLIVCDIVFAEIAPLFRNLADLDSRLEALGVEYDPIDPRSAFLAGEIFKRYRKEGGPRKYLVPDFLIAAHALVQADGLCARDRGYLRRYFPQLRIIEKRLADAEDLLELRKAKRAEGKKCSIPLAEAERRLGLS